MPPVVTTSQPSSKANPPNTSSPTATTLQSSPPLDTILPYDHLTIHVTISPPTSLVDGRNTTTSYQAGPQSLSAPPINTTKPLSHLLVDHQEILASSIFVNVWQLLNPSVTFELSPSVAPQLTLLQEFFHLHLDLVALAPMPFSRLHPKSSIHHPWPWIKYRKISIS